MIQTKVFKSNQTQAVRLPKAVLFPDSVKDVQIVSIGNSRLITTVDQSWDLWFEGKSVASNFMDERDQPEAQTRESL